MTNQQRAHPDDGVLGMRGTIGESVGFGGTRDRLAGRGWFGQRHSGRGIRQGGHDLGSMGQGAGLSIGGRGLGGIAAEDLQVERLAAQDFERQGGPCFRHVAFEVDEEHVFPRTVGSRARFQLGHAQPVLGQDLQAAEQRTLLVPGGQDQAGLAGHPHIHRNRRACQRHVAHEDLVLVAHVPVQDVQLMRRRSLGGADGGQGRIPGLSHRAHRLAGIEEGHRVRLGQGRDESRALIERQGMRQDPAQRRGGHIGRGRQAQFDPIRLLAHDVQVLLA
jgi:hypothetical protein